MYNTTKCSIQISFHTLLHQKTLFSYCSYVEPPLMAKYPHTNFGHFCSVVTKFVPKGGHLIVVPLVPYVNILVCFCHAEMFNTKHNLECIQVKTVTINLHKRRNEGIESLLRLLAKSISKHIIFGCIKRTGVRQCHPRDIDRMPVAIYCM